MRRELPEGRGREREGGDYTRVRERERMGKGGREGRREKRGGEKRGREGEGRRESTERIKEKG